MDVKQMNDFELEDTLMDLCGRFELNADDIELLRQVEDERERRLKEVSIESRSNNFSGSYS